LLLSLRMRSEKAKIRQKTGENTKHKIRRIFAFNLSCFHFFVIKLQKFKNTIRRQSISAHFCFFTFWHCCIFAFLHCCIFALVHFCIQNTKVQKHKEKIIYKLCSLFEQSQLLGPFRQSSDKDLEHNNMNTQNGCGISVLPTLRN
jgi:hypothetical protein